MQRLTGLDAAFLALETPSAHMHVMGVAIVDPTTAPRGFSYERVREVMASRLDLVGPLRRRVIEVPLGLHNPVWIEDPDFDLDFHLRRAALPAPGGEAELAAFVADVAGRELTRDRPLWEAWVVEGLEHGYYAFVAKLHHSLIDGASGVEILAALFDMEPAPEPRVADIVEEWHPDHIPSDFELLAYAVLSFAQRPLYFVKAANNLGRGLMSAVQRAREESLDVALPLTAPRLSMNRTITPHRKVAFASVPLADIKAAKNALGVTVNDIVLAIASGALRNYLQQREELPDRSLVAAIPTSIRAEGEREYGNRVSAMFAALPVELDDAIDRVHAVQRSTAGAKGVHEQIGSTTLQEWAEVAAPAVFSRAMRLYTRLRIGERVAPVINAVVSNVPGPPFPLYLAGARLVALHPLGPIFDDCGLNLTVISYLDHVDFGFIACRELIPDLEELAAAVPEALAEIVKAAG
ncbi:MAG TPA: wax ester/triacylglycerol synthase family O-acyltransferase [Acidimicrobiia bacterium]|nr:wax ester/triacylglycerol synthase family O-acyltransferase [Acidimicrobiia bacterium]